MRNGTKLGLIVIALTWLAASIAVSAHFLDAALRHGPASSAVDPTRACASAPTAAAEAARAAWI